MRLSILRIMKTKEQLGSLELLHFFFCIFSGKIVLKNGKKFLPGNFWRENEEKKISDQLFERKRMKIYKRDTYFTKFQIIQ